MSFPVGSYVVWEHPRGTIHNIVQDYGTVLSNVNPRNGLQRCSGNFGRDIPVHLEQFRNRDTYTCIPHQELLLIHLRQDRIR